MAVWMADAEPLRLQRLRLQGNDLVLDWNDGHSAALEPRLLRIECPCAVCVSEVTGEKLLDPESVPLDLTLRDVQPVGNYAYRLLFADGHDSGIYTLERLHHICVARCGE